MDRNIFRTIINENQQIIMKIKLIKRNFVFEPNGNYVFVGLRQSGKSYLLYQRIQELVNEGVNIERIVYINFDDERISSMHVEDFDIILQAFRTLSDDEPIFFFDEIQNIEGWEHFARRLVNQKYRVYITGSNAKMLSRDIATTLGGRYWMTWVYPYSFKEYLFANNIELSKNWMLGASADAINRNFETYFQFGGFPELVNVVAKRSWLNSIFSKIFFSDISARNKVRNDEALRLTIRRLAECVKQPTPYNRIANLIKTIGVNVSTASVIEYVRYMKDACMIFSIQNYISKFVEKQSIMKHYFADNGLLNIFLVDSDTALLENMCAIHLYKQFPTEDNNPRLFYYLDKYEVDFYVPEIKMAVQACFSVNKDTTTLEREISALKKLNDRYPLDRMVIVTRDEEQEITLKTNQTIEIIPIWKFILE